MMRVAIVSDLHRRHWIKAQMSGMQLEWLRRWAEREKPDVVVDAGDYELRDAHDVIQRACGALVLSVPGNHDYYGTSWAKRDRSEETLDCVVAGVRFVGATLWTSMLGGNPVLMNQALACMSDYKCIESFLPSSCVTTHESHAQFLAERIGEADVVVTHHAPSMNSIHERYKGRTDSYFFATPLDEMVESSGAKLWVHGHVHAPCDYWIGRTRVVANPCGYPSENYNGLRPYAPLLLEL